MPLAFAASSVERIASRWSGSDMMVLLRSVASERPAKLPGAQPPSPTQKRLRQTTRMHQGKSISHTDATSTPLHQVRNIFRICRAARRRKTAVGMRLGMPGWYSFVKRKDVLHSSQCFFWVWDSHSIKHSWWTYLILPLHLHG